MGRRNRFSTVDELRFHSLETMFRPGLTLLLLLSIVQTIASGEPNSPRFLVDTWRSEEGLPGNFVRSIGQGSGGFLWVATAEGFARFDGRTFETIEMPEGPPAAPDGLFRVFTPDDGSIWASTYKGKLYRLSEGVLRTVPLDPDALGAGLVSILFVHQGTPHFHYNDQLWQVLPDERIRPAPDTPELARALATAVQSASERGRGIEHSVPPERLVGRDGDLWSVSGQSLVYRESEDSPPVQPVPEFDGELAVSDMLEDREGNLWLASPVKGLIRVRHRRVSYLGTDDGAYEHAVIACFRSTDDTWWLAPRTGGIDRIRDGVLTHIPIITGGTVRTVGCIYEDTAGRLWIASRDASLLELDPRTGQQEPRFTRTPEMSKISAIAETPDGHLWFGGRYGICRWNGEELETFAELPLLSGVDIECLSPGPSGSLYAGSVDGRVFRHGETGFERVGSPPDGEGRPISAILAVDDSELWVSTTRSGLHLLKEGRWHPIDREDGLPDNRLTGIARVDGDQLWLGSLGGIVRASRSDLLRYVREGGAPPRWLKLDRTDGMITRECIGGGQPGVFEDSSGALWFPTSTGLAGVRPASIHLNTVPPPVHILETEVDGSPVPLSEGTLVAGPGRVRLGFHFIGISLGAPEEVAYQVQLEGLNREPEWIGSAAKADYQAVPPGNYTLRVTAINGDGMPSAGATTLPVVVRPHFWQTPWFIALVTGSALLLALGSGWLVARHRMNLKLREFRTQGLLEAERSRISRDLHDELGASLTELSILSALANENPDDQALRPSLGQLTTKAQQAVGELDEIVWATNPSQDSLRSLVEYLDFFAQEFLKTVQVPLQSVIQPVVPEVSIGPRRRHSVVLATREALNNAVKHAEPCSIKLEVFVQDHQLVVRVSDDGKGFEIDYASGGEGLTNLKRRMTDCGGTCEIRSRHGEGTTVTLMLPLPLPA